MSQEKRRKALELRKAGATYADIAKAVGYVDQSGARKAVMKAFKDVIQEPVTELRTMQVERLNNMLMVLWPKVQTGDERAIHTALSVMGRIDVLMGTEAATEVQVNIDQRSAVLVVDGNKDDYIAAMKKMAGLGIDSDGKNGTVAAAVAPTQDQAAIGSGSVMGQTGYPPGMGTRLDYSQERQKEIDAVLGEVVEVGEVTEIPEAAAVPTKKTFSFGVDPTVNRKDES